MNKFRKKPVTVEAIQWNGNTNLDEVRAFVGKQLQVEEYSVAAYKAGAGRPYYSVLIETKEGIMKADPRDWIIKEPFPTGDRDFYPCKNEIFRNTYHVDVSQIPDDMESLIRQAVDVSIGSVTETSGGSIAENTRQFIVDNAIELLRKKKALPYQLTA